MRLMSGGADRAGGGIHYLDHAATSWPKPPEVGEAMARFLAEAGGNPGRGGHRLSIAAARWVFSVRERVAERFGLKDPAGVIFTANATESLNIALKGLLAPGDHVVASVMEHNSVLRPLERLRRTRGVRISLAQPTAEGRIEAAAIEEALATDTRMVVVTHASNVTGTINPLAEIAAITSERGILLLVDAAQTAGVLDIDIEALGIDLLAASGHKGFEGPTGIGMLLIRGGIRPRPLREGGTGSFSERLLHPLILPGSLEAGTLNTVGIAGLGAALEVVTPEAAAAGRERSRELTARFLEGLAEIPGLVCAGVQGTDGRLPVFSLDFPGRDNAVVAQELDERFGVLTRVGLHCAPLAHRAMGTFPQGSVRFSFGRTTSTEDVEAALAGLRAILES